MNTTPPAHTAPVIVITGAMAAGKSTVAQALAATYPQAAHVRGDTFRRWIVTGAAAITPPLDPTALEQLRLRHLLAARAADTYAAAGFTAIVQDILLGPDLTRFLGLLQTRPSYAVVLAPDARSLARRDRDRDKTGYGAWSPDTFAAEAAATTGGLHVDTSEWTVDETVTYIQRNLHLARVR